MTITGQLDLAAPYWPYPGVATVHALVTALGADGQPIAQQAATVRQFTETPVWDAAPPVLQRDVRRWLGLLFFSGTDLSVTDQALGLAGDDADDEDADGDPEESDPDAVAMSVAHRVGDALHHLARASQRMQAARAASSPELRAAHTGHLARHLKHALKAAHGLTENIRAHYPDEAAELDQVKQAVGLAKAVSDTAKAATTAHLLETTLHELAHARRHAQAMTEDTPDAEWQFNSEHAGKHLGGAAEHAGKLAQHFTDNYPDVAKWLNGLGEVTPPGGEGGGKQEAEPQHAGYSKDGETITAQMANGETIGGHAASGARPKGREDAGTISGQLIDLVGPKGYIHNWIFVGVPVLGDRVNHPHLGRGTVMGSGYGPDMKGDGVTVAFDRGGARHTFPVHRVPGAPGFKPKAGPDPARAAVANYTKKGAGFVEDKLGGQSAWNGTVTLWPKDTHPGMAAFMHWNGDMSFQEDAAHHIARNADTADPDPGGLTDTYDMQTPLHELIHSVIPHGESYADSSMAYRQPEIAAIEEGFTELSSAYHAEEFFKVQGLDGRETRFAKAEGGHKTLGELARERADPAEIAAGRSWGAYPKETAAALAWTREVAKAEGLRNDPRSKKVRARLVELADEVSGASARGKPEVMAKQMMRAFGVTNRPRGSGYDLNGEVAQIMRNKLIDGGSMSDAANEARSYLDSFVRWHAMDEGEV